MVEIILIGRRVYCIFFLNVLFSLQKERGSGPKDVMSPLKPWFMGVFSINAKRFIYYKLYHIILCIYIYTCIRRCVHACIYACF